VQTGNNRPRFRLILIFRETRVCEPQEIMLIQDSRNLTEKRAVCSLREATLLLPHAYSLFRFFSEIVWHRSGTPSLHTCAMKTYSMQDTIPAAESRKGLC
jgi:hypothetical protein